MINLDYHYFEDSDKKAELLDLVKDPTVLIAADDQPRLFDPEYREVLLEYLKHHSLYEANQWRLFGHEEEDVMDFFLEHWVLGSMFEKKLCEPQYRDKWLLKYLEYHNFADSDNELLLFEPNMDKFRRFYIRQTDFHCREAERKLFSPKYRDDLRLYVEMRRRFFKDQVEYFIENAAPDIVALYKQLNKY